MMIEWSYGHHCESDIPLFKTWNYLTVPLNKYVIEDEPLIAINAVLNDFSNISVLANLKKDE